MSDELGCHPSDIASQIVILQRYRRSRFDVLGNLGDTIASGVLLYLDLNSLLSLRQVRLHRYQDLTLLGLERIRANLSDVLDMEELVFTARTCASRR